MMRLYKSAPNRTHAPLSPGHRKMLKDALKDVRIPKEIPERRNLLKGFSISKISFRYSHLSRNSSGIPTSFGASFNVFQENIVF